MLRGSFKSNVNAVDRGFPGYCSADRRSSPIPAKSVQVLHPRWLG